MINMTNPALSASTMMAADPKAMERYRGDSNSPEALKAAAQQFEAMMIQEVLKSMRKSTEALADDSMFDRRLERQYQGMYDSQLALEMAATGSLGIARQLMDQVERQQADTLTVPPSPTAVE